MTGPVGDPSGAMVRSSASPEWPMRTRRTAWAETDRPPAGRAELSPRTFCMRTVQRLSPGFGEAQAKSGRLGVDDDSRPARAGQHEPGPAERRSRSSDAASVRQALRARPVVRRLFHNDLTAEGGKSMDTLDAVASSLDHFESFYILAWPGSDACTPATVSGRLTTTP
jgi:hypothetical protein